MRSRTLTLLALAAAASLVACDDGESADAPDARIPDAGSPGEATYTIRFAGQFGDAPAACGTPFSDIGTAGTTVELLDFRMYVNGLTLLTADGGEVPLALEQDGMWQHEDVALLDFEDGTAGCAETGNSALRDVVVGTAPAGEYVGLRFGLGVPEALNHADTTLAPAPLNVGSLFWVWQSGYKFLRLDLSNENEAPNDKWFVHLGSGGCESADPTTAPEVACARPNRPTVTLAGFDPEADTVVVDAAALLVDADVSVNTPMTPPGCMSNPVDVDECPAVFDGFGLSWDDGGCVDGCAGQAFFRVAGGE